MPVPSTPSLTLTLGAIGDIPAPFYVAPIAGIAALATAVYLRGSVMSKPEGEGETVRIAQAVRDGAMAYLKSQYKVVGIVFIFLIAVLGLMVWAELEPVWAMVGVPVAGFLSGLCGWFGMRMATNASARTATACKESLNDGLTVAFRSGAVMGLTCVGVAILDLSFWYFFFVSFGDKLGAFSLAEEGNREGLLAAMVTVLISFKMGASLQALFARVGGGIFTKAADVGADLVGKVEAGIPEDDARNPATIADNVGDNVGDVAGMGADLYESYYSSIIAAIALGVSAAFSVTVLRGMEGGFDLAMKVGTLPIVLAGVGIIASIIGVFAVRTKEDAGFKQLLKSLHVGVWLASGLLVLAAFGVPFLLVGDAETGRTLGVQWWQFSLSICAGLFSGLLIAWWTEYCTSYEHPPTKRIASQAITGPATVIITGIAEGMKSTWLSIFAVVVAILVAFGISGGNENLLMGLYGVGIAAVGMLATLGITLATDAYGPIADNAGGNAEMAGQPPEVRERTDLLDSIGNTTAATGKGFAIGSAALTALALLAAYVQVVQYHVDKQTTKFANEQVVVMTADGTAELQGAVAIYEGHRRFGIMAPGEGRDGGNYTGGAIILDPSQFDEIAERGHFGGGGALDLVEPGMEFTLMWEGDLATSRNLTLVGDLPHDNHSHAITIRAVSTGQITISDILTFYNVTMTNPSLLGGLFIGVMLTFLFCALTMDAVGRAANIMMQECRRQFGEMRGLFRKEGMSEEDIANPQSWPNQVGSGAETYPNYARCVTIATNGALKEMVLPSILAVLVPVATGLALGVSGVMGLLAGGLITGFAVAVFMANAGGAWDNAKKLLESYGRITATDALNDSAKREKIPADIRDDILARAREMVESGHGDEYVYGKGSDDHKATVVGDTVGDPFKDTSGPSLNILIKLLSSVAVVFAGVVVKFAPGIGAALGLS
ncbi:MAG: sodium/proton-translocating pyrophosphatase [Phycisphaerales bacterium]|jgi:K(+)-stimulated pyrophosphate-energized sodium pump